MNNEAAQLVQAALSVLLVPILLFSRWIRKTFATDPDKPTLPEWSIYLIMLGLGLGLSYAQNSVSPVVAKSVIDLWWVQGLLFFIALIGADLGVDATSTKTAHAQTQIRVAELASNGTKVLLAGALLSLFAGAAAAGTMNYPPLDWHRATFGASAGLRMVDDSTAVALGSVEHPLRQDLELAGQFAYSTGPFIALGLAGEYATQSKVGAIREALGLAFSSDGEGGGLQILARIGLVQYFGPNVDLVVQKKQSVDFALPLSYRLLRSKGKHTALYLGVVPKVDLRNPRMNSITIRLQPGYSPQPPQ